MLVGFAGAFRRSELVGLNIEDLEINEDGLVVHLRRSKTDPEGQGRKVGIPYGLAPDTCPVRAVEAWVQVLQSAEGPLFRALDRHGRIHPTHLTPQSVALVVKKLITKAGIPGDYAGHSLRAGLATAAAAAGVPERAPSWPRPATGLLPPCASTSARDRCSWKMPRRKLGCRAE
jgi:integrase